MTKPDYLGPYPDLYVGAQRLWAVFAGANQVWPEITGFIEWLWDEYVQDGRLTERLMFEIEEYDLLNIFNVNIEDSENCGGDNDQEQSATLEGVFLRSGYVNFVLTGNVEQEDALKDRFRLSFYDTYEDEDGPYTIVEPYISADSKGLSLGCTMGEPDIEYIYEVYGSEVFPRYVEGEGLRVEVGDKIKIESFTVDGLFHNDAWYSLEITFTPD